MAYRVDITFWNQRPIKTHINPLPPHDVIVDEPWQMVEPYWLYHIQQGLMGGGWSADTVFNNPMGGPWNTANPIGATYGSMGNLNTDDPHGNYLGATFTMTQPSIGVGQPGYPGGRTLRFSRSVTNFISDGQIIYGSPNLNKLYALDGYVIGNTSDNGSIQGTHYELWSIVETSPPYSFAFIINRGAINGGPYTLFMDYAHPFGTQIDPDPYVLSGYPGPSFTPWAATSLNARNFNTGLGWAVYGAGTPNEQFAPCIGLPYGYSNIALALSAPTASTNFWNNKPDTLPLLWSGDTNLPGLRHPKGFSHMFQWSSKRTTVGFGPILNSGLQIIANDVIAPWDSAILDTTLIQQPYYVDVARKVIGIGNPGFYTTFPVNGQWYNPPGDTTAQYSVMGTLSDTSQVFVEDSHEVAAEVFVSTQLETPTVQEVDIQLQDYFLTEYLVPSVKFIELALVPDASCFFGQISITIISPPAGSIIKPTDRIIFRFKDTFQRFRRLLPGIHYSSLGRRDYIHDGDNFLVEFAGSTRTLLSAVGAPEEWEYNITCVNGWQDSIITLFPYAFDLTGSETTPFVPPDPSVGACPLPGTITTTPISPAPGSTIQRNTRIKFRMKDSSVAFRRILPGINYPNLGRREYIHDGDNFLPTFSTSTRVLIAPSPEEWEYDIARDGGWPDSVITLFPYAFDTAGGETT